MRRRRSRGVYELGKFKAVGKARRAGESKQASINSEIVTGSEGAWRPASTLVH